MVWPFCRSTTSKLANTAWNKWTPIDNSSNMQKRLQKKESSFMKRQLKHGYMIHVLNYTWFVMPTLIRSCFLGSPMRHTSCLPPGHTAPKPLWKHFMEWHLNVNYLRGVSGHWKRSKICFKCVINIFQFASWAIQWRDFETGPGISLEGKEQPAIAIAWSDGWVELSMTRGGI